MVLWLQGKFRCDKHVPDHVGTANVGIQAVTPDYPAGAVAGVAKVRLFVIGPGARAVSDRALWVGNDAGNGFPGPQQLLLTTGQLAVVADAGTTVE